MKRWRAWLFAGLVVVVFLSLCLRLGLPTRVPKQSQVGRERWLDPSHPSVPCAAPAWRSWNSEASRTRAGPEESFAPLSFSIRSALLSVDDTGPPWLDSRGPPGSGSVGPAVKVVRLPVPPVANKRGRLPS